MSMNMFSIFDPTLFFFTPFVVMMMIFFWFYSGEKNYWESNNLISINTDMLIKVLYQEFKTDLMYMFKESIYFMKPNINNEGTTKVFFTLMTFLFISNVLSLFPIVFTNTAHISLNMPVATIFWLTSIFMAMSVSKKNFLLHLTPSGTPIMLMSFMVLIETVSLIIRPITLSVRLMANMVAGHLLLTLLSNFSMISYGNMLISIAPACTLALLEFGVALIQSYVFTLLLVLYFKEAF